MAVRYFTQPNELFFSNNRYKIPSENEKRVLSAIFQCGTLSQPEIIKKTGISQQSVSRLVKTFIKQGILYQHHRKATGRPGQPSINVAVEPNFAFSLGVIIDAHLLTVILMDLCGEVIAQTNHRVGNLSYENYCYQIVVIIENLLQEANLDKNRLLGIGLGLPDYKISPASTASAKGSLENELVNDIANELQNQLNTMVWIESDVNAAALGESLIGNGDKFSQFAYVHIGKNLSSAIMIHGQPLQGAFGNSGEINLLLSESQQASPTVDSLYATAKQAKPSDTGLDLNDFLAHCHAQWPGVNEWITQIIPCFSRIIAAIAAILDPEAIIIGGELPEDILQQIVQALDFNNQTLSSASQASLSQTPLLVSSASFNARALGAATIPLRQYFSEGIVFRKP